MATTSRYFAAHQGGRVPGGRANDGLHVQLLWRPQDDDVTLIVDDPAVGIVFAGSVARERALDAFHHLFGEPLRGWKARPVRRILDPSHAKEESK